MSQGPTQTDAQKHFEQTTADTLDTARRQARDKRHSKGFRTARENLEDLIDRGSFVEYGQLAELITKFQKKRNRHSKKGSLFQRAQCTF